MNKRTIYLDHAATTYVDDRVLKKMLPFFSKKYGNPSSMYSVGREAKVAVDEAREKVAKVLNCSASEIVFTASGTESDNLALIGTVRANKNKGNHVITTKIEHHAVIHALEDFEGCEIRLLDVDKHGLVDPKELEKAIRKDTVLASVMYANNEIGTIEPIEELAKICKRKNVLFHTDACQAAAYCNLDVEKLGVDLITLNGGKIYGPKGVGALYVKRGTKISPIIFGGGQEMKLRSGTENTAGIIGFAEALYLVENNKEKENKRLRELQKHAIKRVLEEIPESRLNGHPTKRTPNNMNFVFYGVEGESILLHLDDYGICVSTGSACSTGTLEPSHVLKAIGVPDKWIHGSIRMTMGHKTTKKDLDYAIDKLKGVVEKLRSMSPIKSKLRTQNAKLKTTT